MFSLIHKDDYIMIFLSDENMEKENIIMVVNRKKIIDRKSSIIGKMYYRNMERDIERGSFLEEKILDFLCG